MKKVISILIGLLVIGLVSYVYLTANFLPDTTEESNSEKTDTAVLPSTPTTTRDIAVDSATTGHDGMGVRESEITSYTFVEKDFAQFTIEVPKEWLVERNVKHSYDVTSASQGFSWSNLKNDPDIISDCLKTGNSYELPECLYLKYTAKLDSIPNQSSQFLAIIGKKHDDAGRDARAVEYFSMHGKEAVSNINCREVQSLSGSPYMELRQNKLNETDPCVVFKNKHGIPVYAFTTQYVDADSYPGEFNIVYVILSNKAELGDIAISDEDFRFSLHKTTDSTTLDASAEAQMKSIRDTLHEVVDSFSFAK